MTASVKPLFEDASAPEALRELVALARADGPSEADLRRLAAHIMLAESAAQIAAPSRIELGSPPPDVAVRETTVLRELARQPVGRLFGSTLAKVMAALGLTAAIGLGLSGGSHGPVPAVSPRVPDEPRAVPSSAQTASLQHGTALPAASLEHAPVIAEPQTEQPVPETVPGASMAETPAPARRNAIPSAVARSLAPARPSTSFRPAAPLAWTELELITRAEAARANVGQALAVLDLHERLYRDGALAQEREVLAIEVLVRAGEGERAEARARRFAAAYPQSAHGPRVRALIARIGKK